MRAKLTGTVMGSTAAMVGGTLKVTQRKDEVEVFTDIAQGSEDWHVLRRGLATASNFGTILATGKDGGESLTRSKLMRELAGEILTGETAESYRNADMERGNAMEPEACDYYSRTRFADLAEVGFVRRTVRVFGGDFVVGASPDRFVGRDGVLEIKTMRPDKLIEVAQKGAGGFPPEHRPQCQGILWVTDREWVDLMLFYRGMPIAPTFKIERDEVYIKTLAQQVEVFDYEVRALVKRIKEMAR